MRTPSGTLHVVDFQTEQIVSVIQSKDYWDDKRHWEIKNNIDKFDFTTADGTEQATTLMQQNLVLKEVRSGVIVPYVITEAEKVSNDRSVITYASGEWILLAKAGVINPQRIEGKTVNEFIDIALTGTKWKRGRTEYSGFHTMTINEPIDPLKFLKDIASLFDLEIVYRAEVVGNQFVGRYVDMVKKRGREIGKEVTLGKDLMGIKRIENSQNICTALMGFVKGEGDKIITVESINNGLPYIVDSDAFQRWNEKGQHKFGFYTPETEQDITPERLMTLMKTEIKKRVNTSVSYEVQAQSIGRVFGLAHELINEGDTIRIKDTGFTPKLYLEARVIAGDESFTDPTQDKYVFGDYREIIDPNEELRKLYNKVLASLGNKQEILDQLDKLVKETAEKANNAQKESEAAKKLAEKVQENLKNYQTTIIESKTAPTTGLEPGKTLWLDISNGKPGILKLWKNGIWDPVVPDVDKVKKETLEQVNTQIESTKKELNTKVADVQKEAQAIAGQISDVKKEVQGKVDSNFVKEQIKDKADKSGVFTRDEINNGFIGKQIYETDKQGNVKKFQEISTSFEQTNEVIKSKAEKQSVTDLGNNLTQVSKTANEAKQTAEGTKQTITELKATVENTEIGVRNLLLETAIKSHSVKTGENKPHTYFDVAKDAATLMQGKNLAMSFLFTGKVTAWGTTNKWAGFEVKITFIDNTFHYPSCRVENRLTLGKQYNQERFTATAVVMDKLIKEITVYALGRDFTGEMLIEKPKLEIGTVPTAWTPAPEDQVTTSDFTKQTVEIEENINGIKNAVSTVQNEQGKLTERVTKSEQTADGFKQSIESLTKKDTEISNKVNEVESTVEGTKKTITVVQQTTNELKKTTTEITEKAGKISEKLESVEKKFDDIKIGGQNFYKQKSFGAAGGTSITYDDNNKWWNITIPAGASGSWKGILYNTKNATLLVGRTYTISYEIFADEVIPTAIDINNFGVTTVTGTNDNDVVAKRIIRTPKTIAGQWAKVSATFTMPDNITQDFYDNSVLGVGNGWTPTKITNIKIRNMQLEEGNIPTSYRTPSEDQVTTDEFTKKTTEIEKSVDGIKESIKTVEKTQTSFGERVNKVEKNAEGTTASVTKLQETQTEQGKTLTQANTTIKQHSEALELTIQKKDVEEYVGGLGTVNELRDADFKFGQKYWFWNSDNGALGSVDTNLKYKGMNTFSITVTGQTQDRWWGLASQFIACQVNEEFVASGYFNTDGKTPIDSGGACIEIEWWTADKKTRVKTARTNVKVVNNTWVRAVCTDKAPANASFVRWRYYVTRNGRLWCAAPMLQRGTIASEFWLHPKDQNDVDKMMEDIANRVATEKYNQKVTELERSITANGEGVSIISKKHETFVNDTFDAYVKQTGSKLQVLDEGILSEVRKGNIISAINQTAEKITIDVAKLNINADTMVKWLTAKGIDTNLIRISGDKITIDGKEGVIVNMLDFLFKDEWGTKTTAVSRRNLIADSDFSSVGKKNIGNADYYGFEGGYGLTWKSQGNVVIEKNTSVFDYEQMVNAARVDMYNYPEAVVNNGIHPGNEYTLSAHFRASMINGVRKTAKPRLHVCCVKFRDNVSYDIWNEQKMDFPEPSIFYGEIRRYSFTFKVPTNYKPQEHALIIKVCSANGQITGAQIAVCVSGVTLYSGKYASMYNWDRAAAERAAGLQPFNAIAVGSVNNNIGPAPDGQTFDISTEKDVKFFTNIRAVQGVNLGGNAFQGWGHIRFTDGNLGPGFYVSSANGWKFNALG